MQKTEAIILSVSGSSAQEIKIARILDFFGVPSQTLSPGEFFRTIDLKRFRLFCPAEIVSQLCEELNRQKQFWQERIHSIFVFQATTSVIVTQVVQRLTDQNALEAKQVPAGTTEFSVTEKFPKFCDVMSGIKCAAKMETGIYAFKIFNAQEIISLAEGAVFFKIDFEQVPLFFSSSPQIIDLNAELTGRDFDIRNHFLCAVPLVLYIKWAFAETCWNAPEVNACLVIDDPLLRPNYGFVNYEGLLAQMKRVPFSTNIAFIPWNYLRSRKKVARLFRDNPQKFSLSIHGCDHTSGEFGSREKRRLAYKSLAALQRMAAHEKKTKIPCARVMVFPQGVFSENAPGILKRAGFAGIVNSEVITTDLPPKKIINGAFWEVALMDYDSFPIFTRRYPTQGVENFAFDVLIGKPLLAVIHHDFCWDGGARLEKFIQQINALNCKIIWRSLGEVVRRSCRRRSLPGGIAPKRFEVEMFGSELQLENNSNHTQKYFIRKREAEVKLVEKISVGNNTVAWRHFDSYLHFELELAPGENQVVVIKFQEISAVGFREGWRYQAQTALRRYLCELRDNYITKIKLALRPPEI